MLSIGAFALIGQVTHRMLRHWDAEGLLSPAATDPYSGARAYDPSQLERLHRIVALRQLGFGIAEISLLLQNDIDPEQIGRALAKRREEIEDDYRTAQARLTDVARRLEQLREAKPMTSIEIVQKSLPALRLAARQTRVAARHEIAGFVGPAFDAVAQIISTECGMLETPVAQYDIDEEGMTVTVGYDYRGEQLPGFDIVELPTVDAAFCGVHLGSMDGIASSWQALHEEIIARGYEPSGPCRELYVRAESETQADWVTELQQPVVKSTISSTDFFGDS